MKSLHYLCGRSFIKMAMTTLIFLLIIICLFSKSTSFIAVNSFHNSFLDAICIVLTNAGDGLCALLIVITCWLFQKRMIALKILATFLLSSLVAQLLKQWFHSPRPKTFFPPAVYTHFLDGITRVGYNSFPSGHAATIFAVCTLLSFHIECKKWGSFIFLISIFVCFTRVYLGDHFIEDVTAGMIIGVSCSICIEALSHHAPVGSWLKKQPYITHYDSSANFL